MNRLKEGARLCSTGAGSVAIAALGGGFARVDPGGFYPFATARHLLELWT